MSIGSVLQKDVLGEEWTEESPTVVFDLIEGGKIEDPLSGIGLSRTPRLHKSLNEFYGLVKDAIEHAEASQNIIEDRKVHFTEEDVDSDIKTETITFSLVRREPGAFSRGAPFEGKIKNLRPILREIRDDPESPQHKIFVYGYLHDNVVRFTMWAKTNKTANARALWFESLMLEYSWFFAMSGVGKVLFIGRDEDISIRDDKGQKLYGRPLNYFVKTEDITTAKETIIRKILVKYKANKE